MEQALRGGGSAPLPSAAAAQRSTQGHEHQRPPESLQRQRDTLEQVPKAMCWTIPASLWGEQARRCWSVTAWGKCPLSEPLCIPSGFLQ